MKMRHQTALQFGAAFSCLVISFLAFSASLSDISKILHQEAERHADKGHMTKTASFQNPRWRTAAILKIVKVPYLSENIIGF